MNPNGYKATLIASHPGNLNAVKSGVYSERARSGRTDEIAGRLTATFGTNLLVDDAVRAAAGIQSLTETLDADLTRYGVTTDDGRLRSQVRQRLRASRHLAITFEQLFDLGRRE